MHVSRPVVNREPSADVFGIPMWLKYFAEMQNVCYKGLFLKQTKLD